MYGDVVTEYEFHPESKCADVSGEPWQKQTTKLLQRRHVKIDLIKCSGKESNSLATVDEGLEHSEKNVYISYDDPRRTEWITKIQPALKKPKLEVLMKVCGKRLCRREIIELRAGGKKPHRGTEKLLAEILKKTRSALTVKVGCMALRSFPCSPIAPQPRFGARLHFSKNAQTPRLARGGGIPGRT